MASRQPERCIPHVQEVFGGPRSRPQPTDNSIISTNFAAERELKHIEKRMSMKKTIRKQISRQLAQAFVENPDLSREDGRPRLDCNRNDRHAHNLTLTKCKMLAKMDANVLDLLRRAEEVAPTLDEGQHPPSNKRKDDLAGLQEISTSESHPDQSTKKQSLWKRFWSNKR